MGCNTVATFRARVSLLLLGLVMLAGQPATRVAAQEDDSATRQSIVELLKRFRLAAEQADLEKYLGCLHEDAVVLGTDKSERFTSASLRAFLEPYFSKGIGWKTNVKQRHVFVSSDGEMAWFEEHTERPRLGPMRATGVVKKTTNGWRIIQFHVALLIPNESVEKVVAVIREQEGKAEDERSKSAEPQPLSSDERRQLEESFEYVWQKIRDTYWDPNLGGIDWQAAHDELKPKLNDAVTRKEALYVLDELVGRMKVSHFSIIPKSAYDELGQADGTGVLDGTTGIDVRIVGDQVVVVSVAPNSPAAKESIRTGWIVETTDDKNIPKKLAEVRKELAGNPHQRVILTSAANSLLRGRIGDQIRVAFRDGDDQLQNYTFELSPRRGKKVRFGHLPEFRVWVDTKSLDGGIGYFAFNAFMNPVQVMTAYNQFMEDHWDAPGVIIDVRGNGGGNGDIAMGMIGWLLPGKKTSIGKVILRKTELNLIVQPRPETYPRPVVVLIDEMSVSAAEFFASGIKDLTGARVIGTRTAGAVLGSQIERLPTGDGFQFAAANFLSISTGKTLEGVGVTPHEVVEPNREMLLQGKDPAVAAAISWIQAKAG